MADTAEQTIRFVGDLRRCDVKPGDRFVLSCAHWVTPDAARHIQDAWVEFMGADAARLLILDPGMRLGVVGEEPAAKLTMVQSNG